MNTSAKWQDYVPPTKQPQQKDNGGWQDYVPPTAPPDPLKTGADMMENAQHQNTLAAKNSLMHATPSYTALALSNSPSGSDPHNPGNPNLNAIPEEARPQVSEDMANMATITTPLAEAAPEGIPGLMRVGRGLMGGVVGGAAGKAAGEQVGGLFGPTGRKIGGVVGGVGGSILVGGKAAGMERNPVTGEVTKLPLGLEKAFPDWMIQEGKINPADIEPVGPQRMGQEEFEKVHGAKIAQAEKEANANAIAKEKLNQQYANSLNPRGSLMTEGGEGAEPTGSGRRPSPSERNITNIVRSRVVTPQEAATEARELGPQSKLQPGEGLMERENRNLGKVRARRAARGMTEPRP